MARPCLESTQNDGRGICRWNVRMTWIVGFGREDIRHEPLLWGLDEHEQGHDLELPWATFSGAQPMVRRYAPPTLARIWKGLDNA